MEMETSGSYSRMEAEERRGADSHRQEPLPEEPTLAPAPPGAKERTKSRERVFFFFVFTVFVLDQITKAFAVFHLGKVGSEHTLFSFFTEYFTLVQEFPYLDGYGWEKPAVDVLDGILWWQLTTNTGAAFSLFKGYPTILAVVSAVLITLLYILYRRWGSQSLVLSLAFGFQIGGALGNFADRARLGEVVDFVATKVPWFTDGGIGMVDFPIFNVADASAVVGTIVIGLVLVAKEFEGAREKSRTVAIKALAMRRMELEGRVHSLDHELYAARVSPAPEKVEHQTPGSSEIETGAQNCFEEIEE